MERDEKCRWGIMAGLVLFVLLFLIFAAPKIYPAELHGYFEFGKTLETQDAIAVLQLEVHHDIWRFENMLYGGWETWMKARLPLNAPYKDIYHIGYQVGYNALYTKIEHFCNHPVYSTYNHEWWYKNQRSGNALTTVSIGVKW